MTRPAPNPFAAAAAQQRHEIAGALVARARVVAIGVGTPDAVMALMRAGNAVQLVEAGEGNAGALEQDCGAADEDLGRQVSCFAGHPLELLTRGAGSDFDAVVAVNGVDALGARATAMRTLEELASAGVQVVVASSSDAAIERREPLADLASAVSGVELFEQVPLVGSIVRRRGEDGSTWTARGDTGTMPSAHPPSHLMLCANIPAMRLEDVLGAPANRAHAAALDHDPFARLAHAAEALEAENAKLAREHIGSGYTAAAGRLAKVETATRRELDEAHQRLGDLDGEMNRLREEALGWERSLRELENSRIVRLSRWYWSLRHRRR